MFEIKTFLEKHSYDIADLSLFTRERYIGLEESSKFKDYFAYRKFSPEYIQMVVTIKYQNKTVIGIDEPDGLSLWEQTYSTAIKQYLKNRQAETMYGIDPVTLKWTSLGNGSLHFILVGEWDEYIFAEAVLPEKEFLEAMLNEAEHFWQVLLEYKVFEGENKRKDSPKDYPAQMIKEIKELREKVKLLK
ncbi:hypothetical protein [Domibacillus iocasae]|uniref:Uncharacterized protein n=1 Tax=Domibacillus iocasae TaxID=1714016 RepID=A0A1E7DS96_9BACI|nr:hypothetical protein [Domibacillus iocasae]OES45899.1 hypothetical protein BA724_17305 [Domibacillus iocasae]